jgi:UDP-glucose 4-epimerase
MKVLVTGGAGFIGSHVVDAYLDAGWNVAAVDNLSTGNRRNLNPRATFHALDIRDPRLREILVQERPDVVNHHAAQSSVPRSVADPRLDADVNILGTLHLIDACREAGVRRIVYASTGGALYGNPEHLPAGEDAPILPLSPYGVSKFVGEHYLRIRAGEGMTWAVLRYSNVYGPRQDPSGEAGVVAIFTRAMLEGRAPTIFGDGTQTRDFVYVGDVAQANVLAAAHAASGIANIATGEETSVNELHRVIGRLAGYTRPPVHAAPREGDVYRIVLEISRARQWLGWTPSTSLDEGLRRTAEWFRARAGEIDR